MRKFFVSVFLIVGIVAGIDAAPRQAARSSAGTAQSARSATPAVSTRSAVPAARSATTQKVAARAATTTQKVINSGTKIASATQNTSVNQECQNKYFGCMDAFCMLDNTSGGRCLCSDRNAELDAVLAEIEKLDEQSYEMATLGVEQIEMGANADAAIAMANAIAESSMKSATPVKKTRAALDLSAWNTSASFDDDDIFSEANAIDGKTGDALHRAAGDLCLAQIPECANDASMLQLLYAQRIKSDCSAYENSLKQRKSQSQTKLATAQKALREAALEQYQNANKYDLGQCTVQFRKCMQTTAGCGDDFANCASVMAIDNTSVNKASSKKAKNYSIKGAMSTVEISASTYDTIVAKKPLCENVTKSCVAVADKVWDTFLREVAPMLKSAELIAEDNARQNCIGNVVQCFKNGCKDNMDEDSYDACLTRPENLLAACKIPLNACGIDASSIAKAQKSEYWQYIEARLASMRVDSCTRDVKSCLQSADRCGSDYSNCVGLDRATIIAMCPTEKLVGCQNGNSQKTIAELNDLVTGIFLDIDDKLLNACQNAVTTKMVEVCGDTTTCSAFEDDEYIGTESLLSYKGNDGDYVIEGLVSFGNVKVSKANSSDDDVKFGQYEIDINEYKSHLTDTNANIQRVVSALQSTANKINQKIALLSTDTQIERCVKGRDMSQIRKDGDRTQARYPNLLDSSIMAIINSGIEQANQNYNKKYNQLVGEAMESQNDDIKALMCAAMVANGPNCVEYESSGVCSKYEPDKFDYNKIMSNSRAGVTGDVYATKYVISGADMSQLVNAQANANSEWIETDSTSGAMLARIVMNAAYSSSTNTCAITTTSTMCKDVESVITDDYKRVAGGIGLGFARVTLNSPDYHGEVCKEYSEPIVSTTTIEM